MAVRMSRQNWIDSGMELLRQEGQQSLTIDRLTQTLGVTKGSFYHHFGNLANYRQALLTWWEDAFTHQPIRLAWQETDVSLRVQRLNRAVRDLDHPLELAIRAWSLRDPEVAETVASVDRQRLECLTGLHRDQGHLHPDLLAYLEYTAFVGAQMIKPTPDGAARALQQALDLWRQRDQ